MNWFFIALVGPVLWALVNIADNYLVSKFSEKDKERSSGGLVLFSSLVGIFIAFFIWVFVGDVWSIPALDKALLLLAGVLTAVWIILYLFALEIEETSKVVPWFLTIPVFGYIFGFIFLGENLTINQFIGSGIILLGLVLISLDFEEHRGKFKRKPALYMFLASLAIAISGILFKYVTVGENFWVSTFWEYLGLGAIGFLIYALMPHYRSSFNKMNKTGGRQIFTLNVVSELMSVSGNVLTNFALLLAPVAMVFLVSSFQPALVLLLAAIGTEFFPHIIKENFSKKVLVPKIIAIALMTLGSIVLFI